MKDRAEYFGLDKSKDLEDFREKYLEASKMAAASERTNDWSKTIPRSISEAERQEIIQFAESKGIKVDDISGFDGDPKLLKAEIETIYNTCNDYGLKTTITVVAEVFEDDADYARTFGNTITFNSKALRDRAITEFNIVSGSYFASRTLEDIALHETGHIIEQIKGVNSIAISKKAYYNAFGEYISPGQMKKKLIGLVSHYSSAKNMEVLSEEIVANKNKPNKFTTEFVELLKGESAK